ncbi:MAG: GIY-YIG nuclease family protein [Candidatus Latescibacterota bacterium]|nr:GIY-YIG nuclease family protein [Candidatus Latescibacterota bacterium]
MLAKKRNGTLCLGMTNDFEQRTGEHKESQREGFTKRFSVHLLLYYEIYATTYEVAQREKRFKKWKRN